MSFDSLAPHYRTMEYLLAGGILQRGRTAFLTEIQDCRRALLLGEGPGQFLVELLRANPVVEVMVVDESPRMLQEARRQLIRCGFDEARVTWIQGNALTWDARLGAFDLVATHFFLDCFRPDELRSLIGQVSARTTADARWLLADFNEPGSGWRKWRAKAALAAMYAFFRLVTGLSATRLAYPNEYLESAGFRLVNQRSNNFGLVRSELWRRARN